MITKEDFARILEWQAEVYKTQEPKPWTMLVVNDNGKVVNSYKWLPDVIAENISK